MCLLYVWDYVNSWCEGLFIFRCMSSAPLPVWLCYCAQIFNTFNLNVQFNMIDWTVLNDEREHETSSIKYGSACNETVYWKIYCTTIRYKKFQQGSQENKNHLLFAHSKRTHIRCPMHSGTFASKSQSY